MSWIPKFVFESYSNTQKTLTENTVAAIRNAYTSLLAAKDAEIQSLVAHSADSIRFMRSELERLQKQVEYERARADDAVNKLLVRDAKVYPLNPIIPATAKQEAESIKKMSELDAIFGEVNQVAEDDDRAYKGKGTAVNAVPAGE